MTTALFNDGFPSAHRTTRQRIESSIDLRRLFFAIDSDPVLIGAGVVYIDENFNVVTLREFQAICSVRPIKVVLREAPRSVGAVEFKRMLEHEPRESKLVAEALGTAVTCGGGGIELDSSYEWSDVDAVYGGDECGDYVYRSGGPGCQHHPMHRWIRSNQRRGVCSAIP